MKTNEDVYLRLQGRLVHECESTRETQQEMRTLATAYNRYVDLEQTLADRRERIMNIVRTISLKRAKATMKAAHVRGAAEMLPTEEQWGQKVIPLWKAVREFIHVAGESSVGDIQRFLTWLGWQYVSRQSIESVFRRHPNRFRVRTKGNKRMVSLKK
jgi:hypothetical protein